MNKIDRWLLDNDIYWYPACLAIILVGGGIAAVCIGIFELIVLWPR